jgi:hypothetical protein
MNLSSRYTMSSRRCSSGKPVESIYWCTKTNRPINDDSRSSRITACAIAATYQIQQVEEQARVMAQDVVRSAAQVHEASVVVGALATHNIGKLRCEYKWCSISVDASKFLDIAQEMAKVNICHCIQYIQYLDKRVHVCVGEWECIRNSLPVVVIITLSLCRSPMPSTCVATQYPAQDSIKFCTARS